MFHKASTGHSKCCLLEAATESRTRQASLPGLPELGVGEGGRPVDAGPGQRVQVERGVQGAEVLHRQPQDGQLVRPLRTVSVNIV